MDLEDHIGDICRKARIQTKTHIAAAAGAAGVSESLLHEFETDGVDSVKLNVASLAETLGLNIEKAERIASGWEPAVVDLSVWEELRMVTTSEGFEVNSFLLWDIESKSAALFDTGWFADDIFRLVHEHKLNLEHLFITHTHGDHIAALSDVRKRYPEINLHSGSEHAPSEQRVAPGHLESLGPIRIGCRLTPGHASDGITYIIDCWPNDAPMVAVVGDAIFAGSMGKDYSTPIAAQKNIREEILSLPPDTLICPGHGPTTTVGEEVENNPFF